MYYYYICVRKYCGMQEKWGVKKNMLDVNSHHH